MPDFDAERFLADVNMPTAEQVERAARLLCFAQKGSMDEWPFHKEEAKAALILHLNRAKWQMGLFT